MAIIIIYTRNISKNYMKDSDNLSLCISDLATIYQINVSSHYPDIEDKKVIFTIKISRNRKKIS